MDVRVQYIESRAHAQEYRRCDTYEIGVVTDVRDGSKRNYLSRMAFPEA